MEQQPEHMTALLALLGTPLEEMLKLALLELA
jgi:hypothetical protein